MTKERQEASYLLDLEIRVSLARQVIRSDR